MKFIALDPGGTTGVAYMDSNVPLHAPKLVTSQRGPQEHHDELFLLLTTAKPDVVICESFLFRQRDKVDSSPVEYIGVVKLVCARSKIDLVMQPPALKTLWDDDKLKQIGLYAKGKQHANDALRHLLYYTTVTMRDDYFIKALHAGIKLK